MRALLVAGGVAAASLLLATGATGAGSSSPRVLAIRFGPDLEVNPVTQDYLTRFKEIDAIWAADDDMAVGVLKAIEQAKRNDIKIVFGGAGAKGMVKTILDGKDPRIAADVSYSPKFIYDAIKLTAEARLKGEKLPATTIIPSVLITKDNAKDFYHPDSPF